MSASCFCDFFYPKPPLYNDSFFSKKYPKKICHSFSTISFSAASSNNTETSIDTGKHVMSLNSEKHQIADILWGIRPIVTFHFKGVSNEKFCYDWSPEGIFFPSATVVTSHESCEK
jgi:hypothetical protein